ncbi:MULTISPECIES: hypothetical protein [unclassified Streptomyces]|uniref:hypothetical protein n=1 Tax=unclassified Streptomyces TaxID=2593676 RepID=UPI002256B704|nr:hypothetical protein [Streptomyces sp. NBC_00198]MCX5278917.1 hypothetical protein [Streptomyces sp. NBC_00198]
MRKFAVGILAAGLFAAGAGTAFASSWHAIPKLTTGGAELNSGQYTFWPAGTNHGAFEWKGNLKDADNGDGHNVYTQVRVEGYSWSRYSGKQKKTVPQDYLNWSGDERYTSDAYIRVCRDRGSLHPDNCSVTKHYRR